MAKTKSYRICSFCSREVYKLANPSRGLCAACYYREKRNGELAYKPKKIRKPCSVENCDELSIAHNLCGKHLNRLRRRGIIDGPRFERWGHVSKHPLAHTYYHMRRTYIGLVCEKWLHDFWAFVDDVGERPSLEHRFTRLDKTKPYEFGNVIWEERKLDLPTTTRIERAAYARAHRAANPDVYKNQHLRKKFGVSLKWYQKRLNDQGGVCEICKQPETALNPKIGIPFDLAVDHCHKHGNIRGLLCTNCNKGLGHFKDNPTLLRAAAEYLERHGKTEYQGTAQLANA